MITIISFLLVSLTLYNAISFFKKDPKLIKEIYFKRLSDYLWAFIIFIGVIFSIICLSLIEIPKILSFSWLQLLGHSGTNLILNPGTNTSQYSSLFSTVFLLVIILFLPYLAKIEEEVFRSMKFNIKERIISSMKFGFAHMIVGVPVLAAIILSFIGFIFSIRYVNTFNSLIDKDTPFELCETESINSVTSLHAKYNLFVIILSLSIIILL